MASRTPTPVSSGRASLLLRLEKEAELTAVDLAPRGALLLAGTARGEVLLFACSNCAVVQRLAVSDTTPSKPAAAATAVAWAELEGEEHVVAGHANGTVRVWHLERGVVVATLLAHRSDVGALALMAPLALLATGGADGDVKLWQLGSGQQPPAAPKVLKQPLQKLKGHTSELTRMQFTPDGEQLISGDAAGGLRVWEVAGGATGRLAHDLKKNHTGSITGIACHPGERLFATCSADRTLRVWDLDAVPGSCIGVHGPEGRREVRALAFTSSGRALLGAYPDGLRTFTLDPLVHHDTAEAPWSKVMSIRYMDGKVIGMSLFKGDVGLHCVDLTRMKPFSSGGGTQQRTSQQASRRASAESSVADVGARGMRFSEKHPLPPQAPSSGAEPSTSASANWLPSTSAFVPAPPAAGVPQAGPAGVFVAEKRRQVLEARSGAVNAGPAVEVHAPSLRHARYTPFTPAVPGGMAPGTGAGDVSTPQAAGAMRTSQGSEGWGSRPPRVSAEENSGGLGPCSDSVKREQAASQHNGAAATCQWEQQHAAVPSTSMLEVASHRGFLAVALQGSREQCGRLQASRALFGSAKAALQRGDVLGAVRLLREGNDLSVAAKVIESKALQRLNPDRFTPELCAAAAPLLRAMLEPPTTPLQQQAALQLLDAILARWGAYVQSALSHAPRVGKVDLALEQRQERSRALRGALRELVPRLERLAATLGGGSAAQMLARVKGL